MNAMKQTALYNLSGRAIPENAKITISGDKMPGEVLVIESFDGTTGMAKWRPLSGLKIGGGEGAKAKSKPDAPPSWTPPAKPRAPYS